MNFAKGAGSLTAYATRPLLALALLVLASGTAPAQSNAFSCVDALGRTSLQDRPCGTNEETRKAYRTPAASSGAARTLTPARAHAAAARRVRDNRYVCDALIQERRDLDVQMRSEAEPGEAGYWQKQLRRVDNARCRQECMAC